MSEVDEKKYSMDDFRKLFKNSLDELVQAYCSDHLPLVVEAMVDKILAKQRKDVADELVRILLEKALKAA